jgi:hypothetical protein
MPAFHLTKTQIERFRAQEMEEYNWAARDPANLNLAFLVFNILWVNVCLFKIGVTRVLPVRDRTTQFKAIGLNLHYKREDWISRA